MKTSQRSLFPSSTIVFRSWRRASRMILVCWLALCCRSLKNPSGVTQPSLIPLFNPFHRVDLSGEKRQHLCWLWRGQSTHGTRRRHHRPPPAPSLVVERARSRASLDRPTSPFYLSSATPICSTQFTSVILWTWMCLRNFRSVTRQGMRMSGQS